MHLFSINCPRCNEASARHPVARSEYPPIAPQFVGGIASALVFELSRKRRFRCERCGELFNCHTFGSRLWLSAWILFWVMLALDVARFLVAGRW